MCRTAKKPTYPVILSDAARVANPLKISVPASWLRGPCARLLEPWAKRTGAAIGDLRLREGPSQNAAAVDDVTIREVLRWAVTRLHGAFKMQFLCVQRGAGVVLHMSAKFGQPATDEWSVTAQVLRIARETEETPTLWVSRRAAFEKRDGADASPGASAAAAAAR